MKMSQIFQKAVYPYQNDTEPAAYRVFSHQIDIMVVVATFRIYCSFPVPLDAVQDHDKHYPNAPANKISLPAGLREASPTEISRSAVNRPLNNPRGVFIGDLNVIGHLMNYQ